MQMHCPTLALMLLQVNEQHIVKQASSCQDKQQVLFLGESYQGEEMVAYYLRENIYSINSYDGTNGLGSDTWTTMNWNIIKMASSWSGSTKDIYYGTTAPRSGAFNGTMGAGNIDIGIDCLELSAI